MTGYTEDGWYMCRERESSSCLLCVDFEERKGKIDTARERAGAKRRRSQPAQPAEGQSNEVIGQR